MRFFKAPKLSREAERSLKDLPGDPPGTDWACVVIYLVAGLGGACVLFGFIALALELRSFWP